jgi:hypothetical protein
MNFGELDPGRPIEEVREVIEIITGAYASSGVADHFGHFIEPVGHVLSETMWSWTPAWFRKHMPR